MNKYDISDTIKLASGNEIPIFGLGTWQLTHDTDDTVKYALSLGYTMIDTSSDYGTQPGIGKGIKHAGVDREDIYITTKVEETDNAYQRTKSNLQELGVDYVDLMLIHRPPAKGAGEHLWEDLIKAKQEGLVKDIGVSNYTMEHIQKLIDASGEIPVVNQIEWSPFGHSDDMMKYCKKNNIFIQAYSPLTRTKRLSDPTLRQIADTYRKTPAQILIRWNIQLGTIPIPKANKKEHLEENIDVFDFTLTDKDMDLLSSLNEQYSALGSLPYLSSQEKKTFHMTRFA